MGRAERPAKPERLRKGGGLGGFFSTGVDPASQKLSLPDAAGEGEFLVQKGPTHLPGFREKKRPIPLFMGKRSGLR
jgi:hypothetical protein